MTQVSDIEKSDRTVGPVAKDALSARSDSGAVIYGLIVVSVLLAAESARRESYAKTVEGIVLVLVLYWLAHSYANLVTWQVRDGRRLTAATLVETMLHELPLLVGAALPLLVVVAAWALGANLASALVLALWTDVAMILAVEVVAGMRAALSGWALAGQVLVGGVLGVLILVLQLALH